MEISWKKQTDPDPSTYTENDIDKLHNEENSDLLQHLDHDKLGGLFPFVDHGNSTANQLGCIGKLKWFDFESDFYLFFVNNQFLIEFP